MQSYRELVVWQKGVDLVTEIYCLTAKFPKEETYGLTSKMRRSAVSIPSNIAEGDARKYNKEYVQFIRIAFGSGAELETQLEITKRLHFVSQDDIQQAEKLLTEVMKMLNKFISSLSVSNPPIG
ncbi:MAG: four helix bundle protein [Minisyncoccota bacterium]